MSVAQQPGRMSREAFLAWDAAQPGRHEYDGHWPVAMVGGIRAHAAVSRNLNGLLWQALRRSRCEPFGGDLRLDTGTTCRFPDAVVTGTQGDPGDLFLRNPVAVFDVLSPGTALTDTQVKNAEYRSIPSVRRYVMISQDRAMATMFVRVGGEWVGRLLEGEAAVLDVPEIGVRLRVGDPYEGIAREGEA